MSSMSEVLECYVGDTLKQVVDNPNDVGINVSVSTKAIIIQIKCNQQDVGKIIGKHGRSIDALKIICMAIKNTKTPDDSRRVLLEVLEDEDSTYNYK